MKEFLKQAWKYLLPLIIGLMIGIAINIPSCNKQPDVIVEYVEKHDTITITKERIVEKTKIKYVDRIDTFYVTKTGDTIQTPEIPIEYKEYKDTIQNDSVSTAIDVKFHGFNADIDSIGIVHNYFEKQETIIKKKKVGIVWYIGIDLGAGGHIDIPTKTFGWGPQAGIHAGVGIGGIIK